VVIQVPRQAKGPMGRVWIGGGCEVGYVAMTFFVTQFQIWKFTSKCQNLWFDFEIKEVKFGILYLNLKISTCIYEISKLWVVNSNDYISLNFLKSQI